VSPVSDDSPPSPAASGRVIRHRWLDRLYHWLMAACVLTLLGTAFLPIVEIKFDWVDAHWIAGVVLGGLVLIHIIRAVAWLDFWAMMIGPRDVADAWSAMRGVLGASPSPPLPGKYPVPQKLYHALIAVSVLALLVTGALMMVRIDTPFWVRNPYWLAPGTWGIVYVVHGFAALVVLSLVMVHIYFGLRPEKLWITRSMIAGWITHAEYAAHHDPARWKLDKGERK
jgi:formate dehydrogenase subunit gamma